jgi:hypothetical protein
LGGVKVLEHVATQSTPASATSFVTAADAVRVPPTGSVEAEICVIDREMVGVT